MEDKRRLRSDSNIPIPCFTRNSRIYTQSLINRHTTILIHYKILHSAIISFSSLASVTEMLRQKFVVKKILRY